MNWNRGVSKSRLSAYLAFPLGVALGLLILSVPLLAHHGAAQFDNEDTCHEGNVDLAHLKNTYEQAHGSAAHPTTNPAK